MEGLTEGAARHVHALVPLAAPIAIAATHTNTKRRDKQLKSERPACLLWALECVVCTAS
jgi:hypothetical protein